jgi:hypothetical protein
MPLLDLFFTFGKKPKGKPIGVFNPATSTNKGPVIILSSGITFAFVAQK